MKNIIFDTRASWTPTILRVFLGVVVFPHGAQKLLGWFNGAGFEGTMQYFTVTVGLPWLLGFVVILLEFFGALALIAGIATRIFAALYVCIATGIIFSTETGNYFFMNWFGNQPSEGFEFFLLWIAIALTLLINGGGRYSFDRLILNRKPL